MDKPADPATPFGEVYQSFLDDLALEGLCRTPHDLALSLWAAALPAKACVA
jgi:hypothetical protein